MVVPPICTVAVFTWALSQLRSAELYKRCGNDKNKQKEVLLKISLECRAHPLHFRAVSLSGRLMRNQKMERRRRSKVLSLHNNVTAAAALAPMIFSMAAESVAVPRERSPVPPFFKPSPSVGRSLRETTPRAFLRPPNAIRPERLSYISRRVARSYKQISRETMPCSDKNRRRRRSIIAARAPTVGQSKFYDAADAGEAAVR